MSKKKKLVIGDVRPVHSHEWKAVRFAPFHREGYQSPFGPVAARSGTRVGLECACGVRTFSHVEIDEANARWMYKAEGEPAAIPDAIIRAFGEEP